MKELAYFSQFSLFLQRELALLGRNSNLIGQPVCLFFLIALLFPFSFPIQQASQGGLLGQIGAPVIWVAALLAIMLSLESLFKEDFHDGALEQWRVCKVSLPLVVLAKIMAHWLTTTSILILIMPDIKIEELIQRLTWHPKPTMHPTWV